MIFIIDDSCTWRPTQLMNYFIDDLCIGLTIFIMGYTQITTWLIINPIAKLRNYDRRPQPTRTDDPPSREPIYQEVTNCLKKLNCEQPTRWQTLINDLPDYSNGNSNGWSTQLTTRSGDDRSKWKTAWLTTPMIYPDDSSGWSAQMTTCLMDGGPAWQPSWLYNYPNNDLHLSRSWISRSATR